MIEYGLLARGEDHRLADEGKAVRKLFEDRWLVPDAAAEEHSKQDVGAGSGAGTGQSHHNPKDI